MPDGLGRTEEGSDGRILAALGLGLALAWPAAGLLPGAPNGFLLLAAIALRALAVGAGPRAQSETTLAGRRFAASPPAPPSDGDLDLACLGHELRTPLNAIIGFAGLIGQGVVPAEGARVVEYARIIRSSGEHMLGVLDGLTGAPARTGRPVGEGGLVGENGPAGENGPVGLDDCLGLCLTILAPAAAQRAVTFAAEVAEPVLLAPEEARVLRQALINLLSNAVKYSAPASHVRVAARRVPAGLEVLVADSGPGIERADLVRLGAPFVRAGAARPEGCEGQGLGLAIVRGLVAEAGGELVLASVVGVGTTARLVLPLRLAWASGAAAWPGVDQRTAQGVQAV